MPLLQFIQQNKVYPVTFISYWVYQIIISKSFYKLMETFPQLGDEFLDLPSKITFSLYNTIVLCGVVQFGVYLFYKYKNIQNKFNQ
jgi:hypothetical protein